MKNNIKQAREGKNMTQKECADALGITLRAWQTYEQGISEPKQELLCRIADMFSVSIDYLLGREIPDDTQLSAGESRLISKYLNLPKEKQRNLVEALTDFIDSKE